MDKISHGQNVKGDSIFGLKYCMDLKYTDKMFLD